MVTVETMCHVVEQYIYQKKGVSVRIQINYHPLFLQDQLNKLNYAYGIALEG
jgi:diketogulonate reductase-like aldo/keto reductase